MGADKVVAVIEGETHAGGDGFLTQIRVEVATNEAPTVELDAPQLERPYRVDEPEEPLGHLRRTRGRRLGDGGLWR
jgi:hypothetical protein